MSHGDLYDVVLSGCAVLGTVPAARFIVSFKKAENLQLSMDYRIEANVAPVMATNLLSVGEWDLYFS